MLLYYLHEEGDTIIISRFIIRRETALKTLYTKPATNRYDLNDAETLKTLFSTCGTVHVAHGASGFL